MRIVPKIKQWVQDSKCESLRVYIVDRNNRRLVLHKMLLFPEKNRKDVMEDLTDAEREDVTIHFVRDVRQVLELALEPAGEPASAKGTGNREQGKQRFRAKGP